MASAERSASGKVQAQVEDRKPGNSCPRQADPSKGSQGQRLLRPAGEDKQASGPTPVWLSCPNISDLTEQGRRGLCCRRGSSHRPSGPQVPAAIRAEVPGVPATPTAPAPATPEVPAEAASTPADACVRSLIPLRLHLPPRHLHLQRPHPRWSCLLHHPSKSPASFDGLMEDPMIPLAGGGLLALLIGYGAYRVVQRRRGAGGVDSSFMESRIQPDSFFGASGGQRIDTANSEMTTGGSSMAYSPSQLDAGGDGPCCRSRRLPGLWPRPASGRDSERGDSPQPARVSVHVKLGEIYAKRQDRKARKQWQATCSSSPRVRAPTGPASPNWAAAWIRKMPCTNPVDAPAVKSSIRPPAGGFASTVPAAMGAGAAAHCLLISTWIWISTRQMMP